LIVFWGKGVLSIIEVRCTIFNSLVPIQEKYPKMIRVIVADDYPAIRHLIYKLFERMPDIEPVGEASDGFQVVKLAKELRPDVALVDISMPGLSGLEAAGQIVALGLETKVIVVSTNESPEVLREAMENGVAGYLPKGELYTRLETAVRAVYGGQVYFPPR
jgi:DNA-binding NarL/FixJ family response regulator